MRILLVEDDRELTNILTSGFREHHIEVIAAPDFAEGQQRAALGQYGVIILDVMLPGGDGFELCRRIRSKGIDTPILMLTARGGVEDRVAGLEAGADDYLAKPFAFRELLARVRALSRRQPALKEERKLVADLEIDLRAREVKRAGEPILLTAKEWDLLQVLAEKEGAVVTRTEITERVWDENHDPFTNVLEVLVRRLRRKIDDGFEPKLIHTIRGAGYRFGP
ncbi:MAG TPA: response regulator transcription factor [Longimicrobiales bacterium]|nr:response regulator transcription factor [Longimicrobiales bacterium]